MAPEPQKSQPYLRILEQPKSNALRFRYQCEGRGAGALQGERSTAERKTYPRVQICNYKVKRNLISYKTPLKVPIFYFESIYIYFNCFLQIKLP